MDPLVPTVEHPETEDVRALLLRHFELMRAGSPEESCHVMAPETLMDAQVTLLGLRRSGELLGVGGLAQIGAAHGELKSMHTAIEARGQGIGRALLRALLAHAQDNNLSRVSLETGSAPSFLAARTLYASEGFEICPPFGSYVEDPLSTFMTRLL